MQNLDADALADWGTAAHHEAGHAVAAFVLGDRLRSVSIFGVRGRDWDWSGETETFEESEVAADEIIRLLAGPMAEAQFCGCPGVELHREACRQEVQEAKAMATDIGHSYDDLRTRAVDLVEECWPSIKALVEQFAVTDQIDGAVAAEVIAAHLRNTPGVHGHA